MTRLAAEPLTFAVEDRRTVSGLIAVPPDARACCVLAHGAGAGMRHAFLETVAAELSAYRIATLRYHFPYMEQGARRPDPPALCRATVRAAVREAARLCPSLPLIAGGKSFGGRMTSQAQAASPLPGVLGLAFLGFPLHPAGRPSSDRAAHLARVSVPMLFVQGTRDQLADLRHLRPMIDQLESRASLVLVEDADHSFHVPARTGRRDFEVWTEVVSSLATWIAAVVGGR